MLDRMRRAVAGYLSADRTRCGFCERRAHVPTKAVMELQVSSEVASLSDVLEVLTDLLSLGSRQTLDFRFCFLWFACWR